MGTTSAAHAAESSNPMLSDTVKYWLAVGAIVLVMYGYSGKVSSALIFAIAGAGAFAYWQVMARRRKRALDSHADERPRGA
jgi:hypothetical protein